MKKQEYTNRNGEKRFRPVVSERGYHKAEREYKGFCLGCGHTRGECEPDARKYSCPHCKRDLVYGLPELAVMGLLIVGGK